jgi:hypothetical protein
LKKNPHCFFLFFFSKIYQTLGQKLRNNNNVLKPGLAMTRLKV